MNMSGFGNKNIMPGLEQFSLQKVIQYIQSQINDIGKSHLDYIEKNSDKIKVLDKHKVTVEGKLPGIEMKLVQCTKDMN